MAKKTDSTSKPAAALKPAAPTKPAAPAKRAPKPAARVGRSIGKSTKSPGAKTKRVTRRAAPPYTRDDVALRAYFISEKRRAHGLHGDEHQDWIEAERQLAAESARRKKAKKA